MPRKKKQNPSAAEQTRPTKEELELFVEEEGKRAKEKRQKAELEKQKKEEAAISSKKETQEEKNKRIAEECSSVFYGTYYTMFVSDIKTAVDTMQRLSTLSKIPVSKLVKMVRLPFLTIFDQDQVMKKLKL